MERGSSPGLVVAHVRSSSSMPARHCSCPRIVAHVHSRSWVVVFVHAQSSSFTGSFVGACHRTCHSHLIALSMGGGAGHLWLLVVLGPRRRSWLVVWSRRCVVVRWCHRRCCPWGGPLTICGMSAWLVCYTVSTVILGLQTRLVNWGGDDDSVATHIPQRPHHIHGMGALLIHYPACTIVLGLQKRLVRWGAMTTGGRSPSQRPATYVAWALRLFTDLLAPASERRADDGRR